MRLGKLAGQTVNNIDVISVYNVERVKDKPTRVFYNCLCVCGNYFVARQDNLLSGNTLSCGCVKTNYQTIDMARGISKGPKLVECITTGIVYPTIASAAESTNISRPSILTSIRTGKTVKGLKFNFPNSLLHVYGTSKSKNISKGDVNMGRPTAPDVELEILKLYTSQAPYSEIQKITGASAGTIARVAKDHKLCRKGAKGCTKLDYTYNQSVPRNSMLSQYSDDVKLAVAAEYELGVKVSEISEHHGVRHNHVYAILRELGVPSHQSRRTPSAKSVTESAIDTKSATKVAPVVAPESAKCSCFHCGFELDRGFNFCPKCGKDAITVDGIFNVLNCTLLEMKSKVAEHSEMQQYLSKLELYIGALSDKREMFRK